MAHPFEHARSSAKKFGGRPDDYLAIHNWFDESKAFFADFRHRALRHHTEGIFLAERIFGVAVVNSDGKQVPVRYIGEQHVKEDLGRIPQHRTGCTKSGLNGGCMGSGLRQRASLIESWRYQLLTAASNSEGRQPPHGFGTIPTAGNQHVGLLALLRSSSCRPNAKIVHRLHFAIEKTLLYISRGARFQTVENLAGRDKAFEIR
jgi:hypothetical protein